MKMIYRQNTGIIVEDYQADELIKLPDFSCRPTCRVERTYTMSLSEYKNITDCIEAEVIPPEPKPVSDKEAEKKAKKAEYMRKKRAAAKLKKED
jgi:hypothetical protein